MWRAFPQHLGDDLAVGEAQDVVEILLGVFGVAAGVRTADDRDGAALAEEVAERVGELGRLCEGPDEEDVEIGRQLLEQILRPYNTPADVVSLLLAPDAHHLGHDAGQVGIHQPAI